jgi:hypothetical protein
MALLSKQDGIVAASPEDAANAEAAGYTKCYTMKSFMGGLYRGRPCPFWLSPETVSAVTQKSGGYYSCPSCGQSHDLLHELAWHGIAEEEAVENQRQDAAQLGFQVGGGTRIGLSMQEQAEIGENLIESLGELPGYGPITWWHQGGATAQSPLDGATKDWGIEVKAIGYDAKHHRFVPGRVKEKDEKNAQAQEMGKLGVLGVLVLLDYRRSVADIYVREYPIDRGVGAFRSNSANHLVAEVPFKNPLHDPHSVSPHTNQSFTSPPKDTMPF